MDKCRKAGLNYNAVYLRIHRYDWPERWALTTPIGRRGGMPVLPRIKAARKGKC